jgi:hypothetical protein
MSPTRSNSSRAGARLPLPGAPSATCVLRRAGQWRETPAISWRTHLGSLVGKPASHMSGSKRPRHSLGCMHGNGHAERQSHETGGRTCSFGQILRMVGCQSGPASGGAYAGPRADGERAEAQLDRSVVLGSSRQPAGDRFAADTARVRINRTEKFKARRALTDDPGVRPALAAWTGGNPICLAACH